ncbi:MAG TPA: right-handed parallel beta-helix repeat-containing protein, partial [Polyangia bacterium]
MRGWLVATLGMLFVVGPASAAAATLTVGPGKQYAAPCAAIAAAATGDRIEIDAAGSYSGDVCGWTTNGLTIVGVNGRPKIDAGGTSAQGKATWVITGDDTTVENVEMTGAMVADANGAGIRQEGKNLTVIGCYFHDNQDGILAGDAAGSTIVIEGSEFAHNGAGDGQSHNLYINHVDKLVFRWNYSHHANVGHLLKTRALVSDIRYNRFSDEADGTSSYEINVPNAGTTMIVGNLIEQGPMTMNSAIIDYGSEPSGFNPTSDLYVVNNTIVNDRGSGTFVQIAAMVTTPAVLTNDIFVGGGTVTTQASAVQTANYTGAMPMLASAATYDYHLLPGSPCVDAGQDPGMT